MRSGNEYDPTTFSQAEGIESLRDFEPAIASYGASAGGDVGRIDAIRSRNLATSCLIAGVKSASAPGSCPGRRSLSARVRSISVQKGWARSILVSRNVSRARPAMMAS